MAGFPSLPLFVKDYLIDTTALTLEQSGAYLHLLMHAWSRGGSLPDDDRQLAAFCKCSVKKWLGIRPAVAPYFVITEGRWWNGRLSREWQYVKEVSEKRAAAGARGGASRSSKNNDLPKQMLEPGLSKTQAPTPTPTPTPTIKRDAGASPKVRGSRLPDDWQPDDDKFPDTLADRIRELIPEADRAAWVSDQVASFRDYWAARAGAGACKLDWDKTLHTWLRKELNDVRRRNWARADATQARVISLHGPRR